MVYFIIIAAGSLIAMQAGSNATLQRSLNNPFMSSAVSFGTGLAALSLALLLYLIVTKQPLPSAQQWTAVPWWGWMGGSLGALYVLAGVLTAERVGTAVFVGLSVTASIVASLAIDHFGLLGLHRHPAGLGRLMGGALMILGMLLIGRF